MERTFIMIKPDAVRGGHVGNILRRFEAAGLAIRGMKMVCMDRREAEGFYQVHRERQLPSDTEFKTVVA